MTIREERKSRASIWHELLERKISRRAVLAGAAALPLDLRTAAAPLGATRAQPRLPFAPINPSSADAIGLPKGFRYDLLARRGHDMGDGSIFGDNADFTAFFPMDLLQKGVDKRIASSPARRCGPSSSGRSARA
jgi:secreted PhoX family phosphatase